jgi:hypothetical protein
MTSPELHRVMHEYRLEHDVRRARQRAELRALQPRRPSLLRRSAGALQQLRAARRRRPAPAGC